jgi:2-dehydro-3-deoxyphosphogluconate aldolase / (4S)-4-hydroxy-2-oxoglutarate aldolase
LKRSEVRARIEEIGIVPAVRVSSEHVARFAAEAIARGGIPVVEIEMTVPGAVGVIGYLVQHIPDMIVGAGSIYDAETARRCIAAGAQFLTTDGLELSVIEFANKEDIAAWKAGPDFVKVFPCAPVGGESYIRILRKALAHVPLIAAGGVNQQTAQKFIVAGATALGVGADLIPEDALRLRQSERIRELAQRFRRFVTDARGQIAALRKRQLRN